VNKSQAKRIALAVNASYILFGAETDAVTSVLSAKDIHRFQEAQNEMAWDMLRSAGFDKPMQADEILSSVLGST
jgi:hypothetical protein